MAKRVRRTPIERVWDKIVILGLDDCWLWTGNSLPKGYGITRKFVNDSWVSAYVHREITSHFRGLPSTGQQALHSCDNPRCCNPVHLRWGTESINRREARDRLGNQGNQKLSAQQVEQIRKDSRVQTEIAKEYKVHLSTIARIKQNKGWLPS